MSIPKSDLRTSLSEVLEEEQPDQTSKERGILVEALLDRLALDFDVVDDESEDEEPSDEEDFESRYPDED